MDLSAAFIKYPVFRVLRPEDETGIHALLADTPMVAGGMELLYDRHPSFRRLLDYQAPHSLTTVAEVAGDIRGFASFSWGPRWVNGIRRTAMYIGDFRVKTDRRIAAGWRFCYPRVLDQFARDGGPGSDSIGIFYTAILKDNVAARHSLIARTPEHRARNAFYYDSIADLAMVNVFFRPRIFFRSAKDYAAARAHVRIARADDPVVGETKLRDFLRRTNEALDLGYDFSVGPNDEWVRRSALWPGYRTENFFVALDSYGEIVASTLPWAPSEGKRMRIRKLPRGSETAIRVLNGLFGGLLRKIGIRIPRVGEIFETRYLTHLLFRAGLTDAARAEVIADFLDETFRLPDRGRYAMVSYADPANLRSHGSLRNAFTQVTGVEVFRVSTAENPGPPHRTRTEIAFEMALV